MIDYGCLAISVIALGVFAGDVIFSTVSSNAALRRFDEVRAAVAPPENLTPAMPPGLSEAVDFSLCSERRVRAYRASLVAMEDVPFAVVDIRAAHLRVPVYKGTGEGELNRGAGWIPGTAQPGQGGNIAIAGHRDGFFRGLKDVSIGDAIDLSTIRYTASYTVDQIRIVEPGDTSVLRPRAAPSLTLVTCYPFYFIGDAPRRYIVHGSLKGGAPENPIARGDRQ